MVAARDAVSQAQKILSLLNRPLRRAAGPARDTRQFCHNIDKSFENDFVDKN